MVSLIWPVVALWSGIQGDVSMKQYHVSVPIIVLWDTEFCPVFGILTSFYSLPTGYMAEVQVLIHDTQDVGLDLHADTSNKVLYACTKIA